MKQRITASELNLLTKSQKDNLRALWLPQRYQLSIAHVCVNAETDEHIDVEFCIGGVKVRPSGSMILSDLRAIDGFVRYRPEDEESEDAFEEPAKFSKEECLPLLSIGEMIETMERMNFSNFHFYLLAGTGVVGCEVGSFNSGLKADILNRGYQKEELCDVLWAMLRAQL